MRTMILAGVLAVSSILVGVSTPVFAKDDEVAQASESVASECIFRDRNGRRYFDECQTSLNCSFDPIFPIGPECLNIAFHKLGDLRDQAMIQDLAENDRAMGDAFVYEANIAKLISDMEHAANRPSSGLIAGAKEAQKRFISVKATMAKTFAELDVVSSVKGVEYSSKSPEVGFSLSGLPYISAPSSSLSSLSSNVYPTMVECALGASDC